MTNYAAKNVDEFIAAVPKEARPHLKELKAVMEATVPNIEQEIGYGKPYYKYRGWVAGFDVYKHHIGFELWDGLQNAERKLLEEQGYKTGSVTFQIKHDQAVPTAIIRKLVRAQIRLNEAKSANKKK